MRSPQPASRAVGAAALLLAVVASIGWCLHAGPSWSWDRAHYHEYAGFAWLGDRFGEGLLPSGAQGLLNPLGYAPRALLAAAGWTETGIAVATAAVQGAAVWFVWRIARDRAADPAQHVLAALLAFCTPIFLSQLGGSYLDVLTGVGVLAGVWACRRAADTDRRVAAWAAAGGLAMGFATGLKLSNAIPAALAPLLFLALPRGADGALRPARALVAPVAYGLGGLLGVLLGAGAWGLELWRRFGNPVFPMLDSLFNPPAPTPAAAAPIVAAADAPTLLERLGGLVQVSGGRFVPQSVGEWLSFPWRVADPTLPTNMAYVEWHAPDPRLAVGVVLGLAWLALRLLRAVRRPVVPVAAADPIVDPRLVAFVLAWTAAWTLSSSNGRYGVALLMLASVPIVQAVHALLRPGSARQLALLALAAIHAGWALAVQDRADQPMGETWAVASLRAEVPPSLRDAPTLHVVTSTFSWSYLLPRFAPGSTILHLPSMCRGERCPRDLGEARARALLADWQGRMRTLLIADRHHFGRPELSDAQRESADNQLAELDLRIEPAGCEAVEVSPMFGGVWMVGSAEGGELRTPARFAFSCPLVADAEAGARARALRDRHDEVFALVGRTCASVLGAPSPLTQWVHGDTWYRYFPGRDIRLSIRDGQVGALRLQRSQRTLGTVEAVRSTWTRERCGELVWPLDDRAATPQALPF